MTIVELIRLFLICLLISVSATALAVASIFQVLSSQKRISMPFTIVNGYIAAFFILLSVSFMSRGEFLVVFFFIAFFSSLSALGRFLRVYDESFRTLFLSFGYARREYHWHYLFCKAKWVIAKEIIFLSMVMSFSIAVVNNARTLGTDEWLSFVLWALVLLATLGVLSWINESIRNPGSTQE